MQPRINPGMIEQESDNLQGDNFLSPMDESSLITGNNPENVFNQAENDLNHKRQIAPENNEKTIDLNQSLQNVGFNEEMATRLTGAENNDIDQIKRLIEDDINEKSVRIEDLQAGGADQNDIRIVNYKYEIEFLSNQVSILEKLLENN